MKYDWKPLAQELLSIAQAGLTYSKDPYDIDRFKRIKEMSAEIMANFSETDLDIIQGLFDREKGYLTPKVDVRAAVFEDGNILLVREKDNLRWAMPGGWADVGLSPSENAVKEVQEESGLVVKPVKLLAIWDKKFHDHPPEAHYCYKIVILCEQVSGQIRPGMETDAVGFFGKGDLPPLSTNRNTEAQILTLFDRLNSPDARVLFD